MNRNDLRKLLPTMMAYADGKDIQARFEGADYWQDITDPFFHTDKEYRIKPVNVREGAFIFDKHPEGTPIRREAGSDIQQGLVAVYQQDNLKPMTTDDFDCCVIYVRKNKKGMIHLVTCFDFPNRITIDGCHYQIEKLLETGAQWSSDRKNWFDFSK